MARAGAAALGLLCASGCSLLLDFDPSQIPVDAAPYTQAECDFGEPNNAPSQSTPITAADTGPAAICAGAPSDHDYYRFTVPPSTKSVVVKVTFASGPGRDLDLRLTDVTGGTMIAQSRGFEDVELVECPGTAPACPMLAAAEYLFEVFPARAGEANRYEFALTITPM